MGTGSLRRAVLLDGVAPERRRQAPELAPAPQVDLPQAVARRVEALQKDTSGLLAA